LPSPFDPAAENPAGELLRQRLEAFQAEHPEIQLEVRIKELAGKAGLLSTLAAAHEAAPGALPDLLLLPAEDLNAAALKGLLSPIDSETIGRAAQESYDYALAAVKLDNALYGLPLGAQTTIFAYRKDAFQEAPVAWSTLLSGPATFAIPGGSPRAEFVLALYIAQGGTLMDSQGKPALQVEPLQNVLTFLLAAQDAGLLIPSSLQFTSAEETWKALRNGMAHAASAPLPAFLATPGASSLGAVPLPTADGEGIVLARTWAWSLAERPEQDRQAAIDLMAWLAEPSFASRWGRQVGLLPAAPAQLERWPQDATSALASRLLSVAQPSPRPEVWDLFGGPLQAALRATLAGDATPRAAAQEAAEKIQVPQP